MAVPIFHMVPGAPTPGAPYSHLVEIDGWLFLTGQLPVDPHDDRAPIGASRPRRGTLEPESRPVGRRRARALVAARVFPDGLPRHYRQMNRVYASYRRPDVCGACVGVPISPAVAWWRSDAIARRPVTRTDPKIHAAVSDCLSRRSAAAAGTHRSRRTGAGRPQSLARQEGGREGRRS
jgi:hypothetical protein